MKKVNAFLIALLVMDISAIFIPVEQNLFLQIFMGIFFIVIYFAAISITIKSVKKPLGKNNIMLGISFAFAVAERLLFDIFFYSSKAEYRYCIPVAVSHLLAGVILAVYTISLHRKYIKNKKNLAYILDFVLGVNSIGNIFLAELMIFGFSFTGKSGFYYAL